MTLVGSYWKIMRYWLWYIFQAFFNSPIFLWMCWFRECKIVLFILWLDWPTLWYSVCLLSSHARVTLVTLQILILSIDIKFVWDSFSATLWASVHQMSSNARGTLDTLLILIFTEDIKLLWGPFCLNIWVSVSKLSSRDSICIVLSYVNIFDKNWYLWIRLFIYKPSNFITSFKVINSIYIWHY